MLEPLASIGSSRLYAADVVQFLREYQERKFDVTVTSPPYNLGKEYGEHHDDWALADYFDWVELWGRLLYEQTEVHGRLCVNVPLNVNLGGNRLFACDVHTSLLAAGWEFQTVIVWDKLVTNASTAYGSFCSANAPNIVAPVELILVYNREGWNRQRPKGPSTISKEAFMEWRSSAWRFPGAKASKLGHPAPFPQELPKRLLQLFSFEDDLIFDPFVGSGTTCEVAEMLGRASVGVDQHADYLTSLAIPKITAARNLRQGALTDSQGALWMNLTLIDAASASAAS